MRMLTVICLAPAILVGCAKRRSSEGHGPSRRPLSGRMQGRRDGSVQLCADSLNMDRRSAFLLIAFLALVDRLQAQIAAASGKRQ